VKDGDKLLTELRIKQLEESVRERDIKFRMLLFNMYMEGSK